MFLSNYTGFRIQSSLLELSLNIYLREKSVFVGPWRLLDKMENFMQKECIGLSATCSEFLQPSLINTVTQHKPEMQIHGSYRFKLYIFCNLRGCQMAGTFVILTSVTE